MKLKYDTWEIMQGDVLDRLADLPDNSVHCVCTSPPYFSLRDYGVAGQIGLEASPAEFVSTMVRVFREVRRVLRDDGQLWLNLGDSYAGGPTGNQGGTGQRASRTFTAAALPRKDGMGMKPKDLMMMPARVAIALQDDGWWLRSDIIWCKRAPMPESVTDRPTTAHEHIFLLTKSARYFYDAYAVREAAVYGELRATFRSGGSYVNNNSFDNSALKLATDTGVEREHPQSRNTWSYWLLSPEPTPEAHFATFPTEIPRRAILAGTSAHGVCSVCQAPWRRVVPRVEAEIVNPRPFSKPGNDDRNDTGRIYRETSPITTGWQPTCTHNAPIVPATVLDPFSGAGTTVKVALRLQRRGIGIELNPEYVAMSERIIRNDAPLFNSMEVVA